MRAMNAWRKQRLLGPVAIAVVMVAPNGAWAQDGTQEPDPDGRALNGQVRAGLEYDDNALRVGGDAAQADGLLRYFVAIDGSMRASDDGRVALLVQHGGKRFLEQALANTLLTQVATRYTHRLADTWTLGASLDLKDRTSEVDLENPPDGVGLFDYTSGGAGFDLGWRAGRFDASLGAGWRLFSFKPNEAASSNGPSAQATVRVTPIDVLSVSLGYTVLSRRFSTAQIIEDPDAEPQDGIVITIPTDTMREDIFHVGRAALSWRGPVILNVGYNLLLNRSNSFGQDLLRQNLEVTLTAPLFWELLASGYVQLQRTSYDNPIFVDANFQIDEDNRNAVVASLSRPLGDDWEVELRYSLYTQEFGGPTEYSRQTLMLALGYNFER